MTYLEVRNKFVDLSGRLDLINVNLTDNGADFFLNAGQRYLDRLLDIGKTNARNVQQVAAGVVKVKSLGLRSVREVWVTNSSGERTELAKNTLNGLRNYYGEVLTSADRGTPVYYAPVNFRPYADSVTASSWTASYLDTEDLELADAHHTYDGVVIMPPPDATYTVSINGLFYSPTLSATLAGATWTQTKSYWTEVHPEMLLHASLYILETFYRNTEGAKDYKAALMDLVTGIDFDAVEQDIAGNSQMEG